MFLRTILRPQQDDVNDLAGRPQPAALTAAQPGRRLTAGGPDWSHGRAIEPPHPPPPAATDIGRMVVARSCSRVHPALRHGRLPCHRNAALAPPPGCTWCGCDGGSGPVETAPDPGPHPSEGRCNICKRPRFILLGRYIRPGGAGAAPVITVVAS